MLENIDLNKLKQLNFDELDSLSEEIREYILYVVSKNGGHLASNLGMVELTIAIHKAFDAPKDKIIFDVSHQSYTHKILTNRYNEFKNLRKLDGISGFTKYSEGEYDAFEAGHSSTAISAGIGYLEAKKVFPNTIGEVVAIVGDASIFNGLSFEGLNYLTNNPENKMIIILNDNEMGISKNIPTFDKSNFFTTLGFDYYGIIDGHDISEIVRYLEMAKHINKTVVIHVKTQKGKGFLPAELDETGVWHGITGFDLNSNKLYVDDTKTTYGKVISNYLIDYIRNNKNGNMIKVITPAMMLGSGLEKFANQCPDNFIDVGLAEENACLIAASMAHSGLIPIVFCYSTFLQRSYDELLHDIARSNEHVIICVDHAGIVSSDGDTHQGIFDLGYLYSIPNIKILAPSDAYEVKIMINYAINELTGPVVIRYSKEKIQDVINDDIIDYNPKWNINNYSEKVIITYGILYNEVLNYVQNNNLNVSVINAHSINPIDTNLLDKISNMEIIVYEEVYQNGSLADRILSYYNSISKNVNLKKLSLGNTFLEVGTREELLRKYKISLDDLKKVIGD